MNTQQQAKHTPGPWQVDWMHNDRLGDYLAVTALGDYVAQMTDRNEHTLANARLIASAPALLDYVTKQAQNGDTEAVELLKGIYGRA